MSKMEIGIAKTRQIADEIAWRHFWLAHVMTPPTETEYRRWFQFWSIERRN
jgi:hypothetical protein